MLVNMHKCILQDLHSVSKRSNTKTPSVCVRIYDDVHTYIHIHILYYFDNVYKCVHIYMYILIH